MNYVAKTLPPLSISPAIPQAALDRLAGAPLAYIWAPPGFLLDDALPRALSRTSLIWLRLDPADADPATLLCSLIAAARRLAPQLGAATLALMRREAGPAPAWANIYLQLGDELAALLPQPCALVISRAHLITASPAFGLLSRQILARLPPGLSRLLIADQPFPPEAVPRAAVRLSARDLALSRAAARELLDSHTALPDQPARRAVELAAGRAGVLRAIITAAAADSALATGAIRAGAQPEGLLRRLAAARLAAEGRPARVALQIGLGSGYLPPAPIDGVAVADLACAPWYQPLSAGWLALSDLWDAPLRAAIGQPCPAWRSALLQAARALADHGDRALAVPLYLALQAYEPAIELIDQVAGELIDLGCWAPLYSWLDRIPAAELARRPWLIYACGERELAQGRPAGAGRLFAAALARFREQGDHEGLCQCLLAQSALAALQADQAQAAACARAIFPLAEGPDLAWYALWGAWQLARMSATASDADATLRACERADQAAGQIGDQALSASARELARLARRWAELLSQRDYHRRAYQEAAEAEQLAARSLRLWLDTAPAQQPELRAIRGWARTPLVIKPVGSAADPAATSRAGIGALAQRLRAAWRSLLPPADGGPSGRAPRALADAPAPLPAAAEIAPPDPEARAAPLELAVGAAPPPGAFEPPSQGGRPSLSAYLLGPFRILVDDQPVESWASGRGRALLKYMLAHHERPIPREQLMDTFWPEAGPEAARNSLNVAIHALRQSLRAVAEAPLIVHANGAYGLDPDLPIWLDVDCFERQLRLARQAEAADPAAAAAAYELALNLYQGDFLADDPYEEWATLPRERLRVAYLDALDRLSQIYLARGQVSQCVAVCQRLIGHDGCNEAAHRRLIRCYARLGQRHLAIRQYQQCAEALRADLGLDPEQATSDLIGRIRQGVYQA